MTDDNPLVRDLTIVNKKGLHARASAKFVQCSEQFDADVSVSKDQITVGGSSIMGLMMLAASPGSVISISVSGREADAAMEALSELVLSGFGEDD